MNRPDLARQLRQRDAMNREQAKVIDGLRAELATVKTEMAGVREANERLIWENKKVHNVNMDLAERVRLSDYLVAVKLQKERDEAQAQVKAIQQGLLSIMDIIATKEDEATDEESEIMCIAMNLLNHAAFAIVQAPKEDKP